MFLQDVLKLSIDNCQLTILIPNLEPINMDFI